MYTLPVSVDDLEYVTSDPLSHKGMDAHALDFAVPEHSAIYAAKKGVVIFVKIDSKKGGDSQQYENFVYYNHIVIKHSHGEYTEYGHLYYKSSKILVGDKVQAGDIIAYAGNTGYSERAHLHFSVFVLSRVSVNFEKLSDNKMYIINNSDLGFLTIPPSFNTRDTQIIQNKWK